MNEEQKQKGKEVFTELETLVQSLREKLDKGSSIEEVMDGILLCFSNNDDNLSLCWGSLHFVMESILNSIFRLPPDSQDILIRNILRIYTNQRVDQKSPKHLN